MLTHWIGRKIDSASDSVEGQVQFVKLCTCLLETEFHSAALSLRVERDRMQSFVEVDDLGGRLESKSLGAK